MPQTQTNNISVVLNAEVFNDAYFPLINDETETQILFGGSSSGKSYFLAERVVYDLMSGERNYLICRKVGKYVMKSVWVEVENVIRAWGVYDLFDFNKSDRVITCVNGKQAIFTGLDEPQKLKSIRASSGPITDTWVEEATEANLADLKELEKRQRGGDESIPKRLMLSFNPILQQNYLFKTYFEDLGWMDDQKIHRDGKLLILKTTYKDNRFLTQQDIDRLENEDDKYYHDVYTLGNWGVLGNVIFTNWHIADLDDPNDEYYFPPALRTNQRAGLDFGYADSPAAVGVSHWDNTRKRIYFYDEFYETEVSDEELATEVLRMIGKSTVTGDSEDPKSIAKLKSLGVYIKPAKKGPGSVNFGIKWLQSVEIIVDKKCIHMQNELRSYKWKEGPDGKPVLRDGKPVPLKLNDHLIDGGLRYAYEDDMLKRYAGAIR